MAVDVVPFELPLAEPLRTATGTIERRRGWLVRVRHDGSVGIGEATPLPGWTESREECHRALERVAGTHDGDPLASLEELADAPAARHGVALAECDRRARGAGIPLHEDLAPANGADSPDAVPAPPIPVNATIGDGDPEETAAAARDAAAAGFTCLKLKVGARDLAGDRRRLDAVRTAIGDDVVLRADANGAWTRTEAAAAMDVLAARNVALVEQPLPADDLSGLRNLRHQGVGIAADESLREFSVASILDAEAVDAVVCKPMVLGGPDRAVTVAQTARDQGLDAIVTTTVDAVVARTTAVHVAAALAPIDHCGLATADRLATDLASDPAPVDGGAISVSSASGTGIDQASLSAHFE